MILEEPLVEGRARFLRDVSGLSLDAERILRIADATVRYLRAQERGGLREDQDLELRWYASLAAGSPDYTVYEEADYLGDLWAGWVLYSRTFLRLIQKPPRRSSWGGIRADFPSAARVVDVGCGFGWTTGVLKEMFPEADVVGTNVGTSPQTALAEIAAKRHGFRIVRSLSEIEAPVDLIWACEYFEHWEAPVDHLRDVLQLRPKALLFANAFNVQSIGHFPAYLGDGKDVWGNRARMKGPETGRAFHTELKRAGYREVETRFWNNTPEYWSL